MENPENNLESPLFNVKVQAIPKSGFCMWRKCGMIYKEQKITGNERGM